MYSNRLHYIEPLTLHHGCVGNSFDFYTLIQELGRGGGRRMQMYIKHKCCPVLQSRRIKEKYFVNYRPDYAVHELREEITSCEHYGIEKRLKETDG